ncbi:MAG: putative DNA binding domain-containing protein [Defluviitaleaceae bacterium]|nr:putative DNA binding domain-containing protein [Defluviitaleaceae bacterium]
MDESKLKNIFAIGEIVAVEFKRCGNGIESDTYETVCSFLNRYGGDIYLGVEDNGEVRGIPKEAANGMIKNFISMISNPDILFPTVYLTPQLLQYEGKTIIHIQVLPGSEVHSYKKTIYDRNNDSDVKVTSTSQIAALYIRKQRIFTEKKVYPYIKDEHLRMDMLPRIRQMAVNKNLDHPWRNMTDAELLQSAGLIGEDAETGKRGYNLAAVTLLGQDEAIRSVCPAYRTDALLRKVNLDRYDDRLIVRTNLIDSYYLLLRFAEKHLLDKFHLEGDINVSLRSIISREMLVNTLIHREFTSPYYAKFVIEKERMYTENANRAMDGQSIKPDNYQPNSKNPSVADFFRNIGLADELGSGVRRLHYYVPRYSGKEPELLDGDVFRIIVPLDDGYSYDAGTASKQFVDNLKGNGCTINCTNDCTIIEQEILKHLVNNPKATQTQIASNIGKSLRTIKTSMALLKSKGIIRREGTNKNGMWIVV